MFVVLSNQEVLCTYMCDLATIFSANFDTDRAMTGDLTQSGWKAGTIIIRAEVVNEANKEFEISVNASGLMSKKLWCLNRDSPFLWIERSWAPGKHVEEDEMIKVLETRPIRDTLEPSWDIGWVKVTDLCNGDATWPIKFSIMNHVESGNFSTYGTLETTLNDLVSKKEFNMDAPDKTAL